MRTALLIVTLALALGPSHIAAADAAGAAKKVGVFSMFPFAYKGADGKLTGECMVALTAFGRLDERPLPARTLAERVEPAAPRERDLLCAMPLRDQLMAGRAQP